MFDIHIITSIRLCHRLEKGASLWQKRCTTHGQRLLQEMVMLEMR